MIVHISYFLIYLQGIRMNIPSWWQSSIRWMQCCQNSTREPVVIDATGKFVHLFDFSPLCVFKWVLKWLACEDAQSHWLHCCQNSARKLVVIVATGIFVQEEWRKKYMRLLSDKKDIVYLHYPTKFCKKAGCNCCNGNICARGVQKKIYEAFGWQFF